MNKRKSTNKRPARVDKSKINKDSCDRLNSSDRDNDPNWYFLDARVADQAGSFSFSNFNGVPADAQYAAFEGATGEQAWANIESTISVPSIMTFKMSPSAGNTESIQQGINLAGLKTYTQLSSMNAKTTAYAPQDVTILLLTLGEVISMLEHIRRAFGVAFTYNQRNRSLPHQLLRSMGFDADDFLENIAQHRLQFNSWITALNKLPMLDNIAYFYKCADMYQKVYLDSESAMAQVVLSRPYSTWILNEAYNDQGSGLGTKVLPDVGTWAQWADIVNTQIESLFTSSTFNYIFSDILNLSTKAGAKLMFMDYLDEGYSVIPEYNRNYSLQMHNVVVTGTTYVPNENYSKDNDVSCSVDKNLIVYKPLFNIPDKKYIKDPIVDFDVPQPNLVDRIEATRYIPTFTGVDIDGSTPAMTAELPDHYCNKFTISVFMGTRGWNDYDVTSSFVDYGFSQTSPTWFNATYLLKSQFDWAPLVYMLGGTNINTKGMTIIGDVNYFTTLDDAWFARINDLTFQALFSLR